MSEKYEDHTDPSEKELEEILAEYATPQPGRSASGEASDRTEPEPSGTAPEDSAPEQESPESGTAGAEPSAEEPAAPMTGAQSADARAVEAQAAAIRAAESAAAARRQEARARAAADSGDGGYGGSGGNDGNDGNDGWEGPVPYEPKPHRGRTVLIVVLAIVAALAVIYFIGVGYFRSHYLFNTAVNSFDVSCQTPEYLQGRIESQAVDYTLRIHDRTGGTYVVNGEDIDLAYISTGEEESVLDEQNEFLWVSSLFSESSYTVETGTEFDQDKLDELIDGFAFMQEENMVAPEDAYFEVTSDGYEIVEEVEGTTVIPSAVKAEITAAVKTLETELTLSDSCYEEPAIRSTDSSFTEITDKLDQYLQMTITYVTSDGEVLETVDGGDILSLLTIDADAKTVAVNSDAVTNFVQQLAYTYNTYAATREFTTSLGDTITIGGGDYGFIVDKEGEAAQLTSDLESGESVEREIVWSQTAYTSDPLDDIGDTYIELDYTNQHAYYYEDGVLIGDADMVSGTLSTGMGSPDGVYSVKYVQSPATLVGEDYSSDVTYFVVFAYNVGIHDASWRSAFGGSIYLYSGSHGCVNVPYDFAQLLFDHVYSGTPVVAYYRESVTLTSESAQKSGAWSYSAS